MTKRQANFAGWIAIGCLVFMWLEMLAPELYEGATSCIR